MATDNTGTTNSPYDAVTIETIAGEIQAAPLNTSIGNLDTAVQSHSHPLDSTVGWDSMKSSFRPPDTGDSTNRWRLVSGEKTVTISASTQGWVDVTFATDSDQGDPSFIIAPRVTASGDSTNKNISTHNHSTTSVRLNAKYLDGASATGDVDVHWMAYGKVA